MITSPRRVLLMAAVCAGACSILALPAAAQSRFSTDPYKTDTVVITATPSYYWGYAYSPYGDIIRAQGDYLIKVEQSRLLRQKVRQEKLVTYRKELEFWEWRRDFVAQAARNERARIQRREREYSLKSPTMDEIMEATPLNTLFDQLAERPVRFADGSTPINQECLSHINITVAGKGNVGLLKADTIYWPQLLNRPDFAEQRKEFDRLFKKAKQEVVSGISSQVDYQVLHDLQQQVREFDSRAKQELLHGTTDPECNDRNFIEARRFLKAVSDTLEGLKQPETAFFLKPLQGKTVAELVSYMHDHGIRFAPGTNGSERFYKVLHNKLADEVRRLQGSSPKDDDSGKDQ